MSVIPGRVALGLALLSLAGCSDRGKLMSLVQRVALTPGVDALDPIDPVPVGQDLQRIEFFLTEPLTQASADTFDPSVHLSLGGLPIDLSNPFSLNQESVGTIPPRALLTVNLAPPPGGIAENTYDVRLISPEGNRLQSATVDYLGEFEFSISVVVRDGKLPYIVRFTPQQIEGVPEELPTNTWMALALLGGGVVPHGDRIPPHAALRAEFSERMRTPMKIEGGPQVVVERFIQTSFGEQRVEVGEIVGVDFQAAVLPVNWNDSIDGIRSVFSTVMISETVEGLEVATDYLIEFPGNTPLTSMQPGVRDRSGEPLTFRFENDEDSRKIEIRDRRGFRTAPIRVNTPDHKTFVNASDFLGGDVPLAISGEVADFVEASGPITDVVLVLRPSDGTPLESASIVPVVTDEINLAGVAIDRFSGQLTLPAGSADGDYEIVAEALDAGTSSHGQDVIRLIVDTSPAALLAGGTATIVATQTSIEGLCVDASADAVRAEVLFDTAGDGLDDGDRLADSTTPSITGFPPRARFCFSPISVPSAFLAGGRQFWSIRLTDQAGNVSTVLREVQVRPVLSSVTPSVVDLRDGVPQAVVLTGAGLTAFGADPTDVVLVDGRDASVTVSASGGPPQTLTVTVPDTVSAGPISVRMAGLESNRLRLTMCLEEPSKFVAQFPDVRRPFAMTESVSGSPVFVRTSGLVVNQEAFSTFNVFRVEADGHFVESVLDFATDADRPRISGPLGLLAMSDGRRLLAWTTGSTIDGYRIRVADLGVTPLLAFAVIPIAVDREPLALDLVLDPATGDPTLFILSSEPDQPADGDQLPQYVVDLRRILPTGGFVGESLGSFQVPVDMALASISAALGPDGSGWVFASSAEDQITDVDLDGFDVEVARNYSTRVWRRAGSTWTTVAPWSGLVTDAAAGGGQFHVLRYVADHPLGLDFLGKRNVAGEFRYRLADFGSGTFEPAFTQDMRFDEDTFQLPDSSDLVGIAPVVLLARAAVIGIAGDGDVSAVAESRVAFLDAGEGTLQLLRRTSLPHPNLLDVLDVDVNTGHLPQLLIDGNGETMVGYLDLSHLSESNFDPTLQFVDTRNRLSVVSGMFDTQPPSVCSPGKFGTIDVTAENWSRLRDDQRSRVRFNFFDIGQVFLPVVGTTDQDEQALLAQNGLAGVLSGILGRSNGGVRLLAGSVSPGLTVSETFDPNASFPDPQEGRGLITPAGMRDVALTTLRASESDPEIREVFLARFRPEETPCAATPPPRRDAALAHDPEAGLVLFGGSDVTGVLGDTWWWPGVGPCWIPVGGNAPSARAGHAMVSLPGQRRVLLVGGADAAGTQLGDQWVFDMDSRTWALTLTSSGGASVPSARTGAAVVSDPVGGRIWLFGGDDGSALQNDLWSATVSGSPPVVKWTEEDPASAAPSRRGGGLAVNAATGRLLLFGGQDDAGVPELDGTDSIFLRNDVWEYDPSIAAWTDGDPGTPGIQPLHENRPQLAASNGSHVGRARETASVAYSTRWDRLVTFGGVTHAFGLSSVIAAAISPADRDVGSSSMDTFSTDLRSWERVEARDDIRPSRRAGAASAYDPGSDRFFVFGGEYGGELLDDLLGFSFEPPDPFGDVTGSWDVVVPGTARPREILVLGKHNGEPAQWGIADVSVFLQQPALGGLYNSQFKIPRFREQVDIKIAGVKVGTETFDFDLDYYRVGRVHFDDLLSLDAGSSTGQSEFRSVLDFGGFHVHGTFESGSADGTFSLSTDISLLTCDAIVGSGGMRSTIRAKPAVEHASPAGLHESFTWLETVVTETGDPTVPEMCLRIESGDPVSELLVQAVGAIATRVVSQKDLDPGSSVGDTAGPLSELNGIFSAILVDAFSNPAYGPTGLNFRETDYVAVDPNASGAQWQEPEWIHAGPGVVRLGTRVRASSASP